MKRLFWTVMMILVMQACASGSITHDFNPTTDFAGLRTYAWMPTPPGGDSRVANDLVAGRFRTAIENALEAKGFRRATSGDPDFRVGYQVVLNQEVTRETANTYRGPRWHFRGIYGPGPGISTTVERRYLVGTLIIDVFDEESSELVWRGSGEGRARSGDRTPEESQADISAAVHRVMEPFPPGR